MTTTQNQQLNIEQELEQATEQAAAATRRARELEHQAAVVREHRERLRGKLRQQFEEDAGQFFVELDALRKQKLAEFEQAVITGVNVAPAWIAYMTTVHQLTFEEEQRARYFYNSRRNHYDAIRGQMQAWADELEYAKQSGMVYPPQEEEPRNWYTPLITVLLDEVDGIRDTESETRVQQINAMVNALATAHDLPVHRELDDLTPPLASLVCGEPPAALSLTLGETRRFERRTMWQAIDDVVRDQVQNGLDQYEQDRAQKFEQLVVAHDPELDA
ncbi:hypothetical protein [Enteractinococcus helveticum]|uniref:Uncharacterized protein n=1 Tax=Enteractinococcus helveticum TaxID=1837282 RepID=A0A1B7LWW7_9MICC|nr:hypothetical protein [Enteractinococcus helveticum]OAV59554.1 hypothetical protein A6F49_17130 [Enteractinococcus helveticum]